MVGDRRAPAGEVPPGTLGKAMVGWAGLAACLVLVYLGMRAVMDVGGACADGGPFVSAQPCPEGAPIALTLGILAGMVFALVASAGGIGLGGIWAATPVFAWAALFLSLGWNFLDYGLVNPPTGEVEWGWLIPGVLFWAMGGVPLLGVVGAARDGLLATIPGSGAGRRVPGRDGDGGGAPGVVRLAGPGQPPRGPRAAATVPSTPAPTASTRTSVDGPSAEERVVMAQIAGDFASAIGTAMADTPLDPALREVEPLEHQGPRAGIAPAGRDGAAPGFTEGTQALLDRLERLADMRASGLLDADEYETAKAAVMAELEGRS